MKNLIFFCSLILLLNSCSVDEPTLTSSTYTPPEHTKLIQDNFENTPIVVVANKKDNFIVSYKSQLPDGTQLTFEAVQAGVDIILSDNEGNRWNSLGVCIEGSRVGTRLTPLNNWMGYWFALSSLYPNAEIYGEPLISEPYTPNPPSSGWLISTNDLYRGAPKDGIIAIDNPEFYRVGEFIRPDSIINKNNYLVDSSYVVGIEVNGEYKAYPHSVLNWHEIVNDYVGGEPISIIYCPLTGTASAWSRVVNGQETTFGVSGLLYNNNVIPYDRLTNSNWHQMSIKCLNGSQISTTPQTYPVIETRWDTWKQMYPTTLVLSDNTPQGHNCGIFPYGTYETNPRLAYPIIFSDNRRFVKERVHAVVINGKAKIYPFEVFEE